MRTHANIVYTQLGQHASFGLATTKFLNKVFTYTDIQDKKCFLQFK